MNSGPAMKNLLQTQSIAWAQGIRVALEAEGIQCKLLNEFDRGVGAVAAVVVIVFIGGSLLIMLGPRADKGTS